MLRRQVCIREKHHHAPLPPPQFLPAHGVCSRIVHPGNWESQQVSLGRQEGGWVSAGETLEGM